MTTQLTMHYTGVFAPRLSYPIKGYSDSRLCNLLALIFFLPIYAKSARIANIKIVKREMAKGDHSLASFSAGLIGTFWVTQVDGVKAEVLVTGRWGDKVTI